MARPDEIYPLGPEGQPMRSGGSKPVDNSTKGKTNNMKPSLLEKWMGTFTDDKGLFQGGMKKRMFGKLRDDLEQKFGSRKEFKQNVVQLGDTEGTGDYQAGTSSKKGQADNLVVGDPTKAEVSEDIRQAKVLTEKAGYDMYNRNVENNPEFDRNIKYDLKDQAYEVPAYSEEFSYARDYALNFDVTNHEQVAELQRRLKNAGYTDAKGNELVPDGMLGDKTMHALQNMQNDMKFEKEYAQNLLRQKKENARMIENATIAQNNIAELSKEHDMRENAVIQPLQEVQNAIHKDYNDRFGVSGKEEDETFKRVGNTTPDTEFEKEYNLNEKYHELERWGVGGRNVMNRHIHEDKAFREYVQENHPKKYDRYKATYGKKAHGYEAPEEDDRLYMGPEDEEYLKGMM